MDENNNFGNTYGESDAQKNYGQDYSQRSYSQNSYSQNSYSQNNYSQGSYNQNYGGPSMMPEEAPMTMGEWLITLIVGTIPCIGIIMLFVWGFGSTGNVNRRNYCRAQLIVMGIGIVLGFISWGAIAAFFTPFIGLH